MKGRLAGKHNMTYINELFMNIYKELYVDDNSM